MENLGDIVPDAQNPTVRTFVIKEEPKDDWDTIFLDTSYDQSDCGDLDTICLDTGYNQSDWETLETVGSGAFFKGSTTKKFGTRRENVY